MRNYILSIVATAIFCTITNKLFEEKTAIGKTVRLLGGILLSVAIIAPVTKISFENIGNYFNDISLTAEYYAAQGEASAKESMLRIIKDNSEAYILDKANGLGLEIAVEVEVGADDMIPNRVTISGTVSPYAKEVMGTYMEDTLGIPKENQQWK